MISIREKISILFGGMSMIEIILVILKILGINGIIAFDCPWVVVFIPFEIEGAIIAIGIIFLAIAYFIGLRVKD